MLLTSHASGKTNCNRYPSSHSTHQQPTIPFDLVAPSSLFTVTDRDHKQIQLARPQTSHPAPTDCPLPLAAGGHGRFSPGHAGVLVQVCLEHSPGTSCSRLLPGYLPPTYHTITIWELVKVG